MKVVAAQLVRKKVKLTRFFDLSRIMVTFMLPSSLASILQCQFLSLSCEVLLSMLWRDVALLTR